MAGGVALEYPVVLERDEEVGGYVVHRPTLRGCVSQGETEEEALEDLKRFKSGTA